MLCWNCFALDVPSLCNYEIALQDTAKSYSLRRNLPSNLASSKRQKQEVEQALSKSFDENLDKSLGKHEGSIEESEAEWFISSSSLRWTDLQNPQESG